MAAHRGRVRALTAVAVGALLAIVIPTAALAAPGDPPETALNSAIAGLKGTGYNVDATIGGGVINATGSVDPSAQQAEAEFKGSPGGEPVDVHFIQTADSLYAQISIKSIQDQLGVDPNKWVKVDESKINNPSSLPFDLSGKTDGINIAGLMTSVSDVAYPNPSDPTKITGTVDLTAATGVGAPNQRDVQKAGAAAKAIPFTATLDNQGRLIELEINADQADKDLTQDIKFTDFGSPDPITVPTNSVPAPAAVYEFLNA